MRRVDRFTLNALHKTYMPLPTFDSAQNQSIWVLLRTGPISSCSTRKVADEKIKTALKNKSNKSVSPSQVDGLVEYILNQKEHHRRESFQNEFRRLCKMYGIEIDERYVWD